MPSSKSPAASLFASDYSLTPVTTSSTPTSSTSSSAASTPPVITPSGQPSTYTTPTKQSNANDGIDSPKAPPTGTLTINVVQLPTPDSASLRSGSGLSPLTSRHPLPVIFGTTSPSSRGRTSASSGRRVEFTPEPQRVVNRKKSGGQLRDDAKEDDMYYKGDNDGKDGLADVDGELASLPVVFKQNPTPPAHNDGTRRTSSGYQDCESFMEGESCY